MLNERSRYKRVYILKFYLVKCICGVSSLDIVCYNGQGKGIQKVSDVLFFMGVGYTIYLVYDKLLSQIFRICVFFWLCIVLKKLIILESLQKRGQLVRGSGY